MTDEQFHKALASLRDLTFREDFEAGLFDLYTASSSAQRAELRAESKAGMLGGSKTWKNPADYTRSDLTREKRARQWLLAASIRDGESSGGGDWRDDLLSIARCYNTMALRGIDAGAVLEEVAELSGPQFAGLVRGFLRRSPEGRSARAWGLEIVETPDGPTVERTHG